MTLAHFSVWKVSTIGLGLMAAAIVAIDPTVKVAIVAIIPLTITSLGGLVMQFIARNDARRLHAAVVDTVIPAIGEVKAIAKQAEVNGNNLLTKLQEQKDVATTRADRAEGLIEGAATERDHK